MRPSNHSVRLLTPVQAPFPQPGSYCAKSRNSGIITGEPEEAGKIGHFKDGGPEEPELNTACLQGAPGSRPTQPREQSREAPCWGSCPHPLWHCVPPELEATVPTVSRKWVPPTCRHWGQNLTLTQSSQTISVFREDDQLKGINRHELPITQSVTGCEIQHGEQTA